MGFHNRAVDQIQIVPRTRCERIKNSFPDAAPRPAVEAIVRRCIWPIALRQIAPRHPGAQHVKDRVRDLTIVSPGALSALRHQLSLGGEFSLIVGAENSLAGSGPEGLGRAPDLRAVRPSPIIPSDMIRIGGGGGPAWRTDDDLGPSPPGIVRDRDCAAYGSRPEDGSQIH